VANSFAADPPLNAAREAGTATLLPNGKVLIAGGGGQSGVISSTQIYDPSQDAVTDGSSMSNGHFKARVARRRLGHLDQPSARP